VDQVSTGFPWPVFLITLALRLEAQLSVDKEKNITNLSK